ncbi:50S ribosomal protein L32 [Clostridia bacterium]|nr:50S ribosomal protein L32 [Clostridia bacterium]
MAVPKRKTSKQRKHLRRSSVWKLTPPTLTVCSKCGEYTLRHRACKACGTYDGRVVVKVEEEKK